MSHQKCIVITGSSRGIGFALAKAFVVAQHRVIISGRDVKGVEEAVNALRSLSSFESVMGIGCDVTNPDDLKTLWEKAIKQYGRVDVWINNAGSCTATLDLTDIEADEIKATVQTNVLESILGSQIALKGMLKQGYGQIFNMEGWGSRNEWSAGMTVYCTTKRAVGYFSRALYKETQKTAIQVGTLGPGMVVTDLLIDSWQRGDLAHWHKKKRLFMFIIDPADVVADYLVRKILRNKKANARIVWMTPLRLIFRFFRPYYWQRNPIKGSALDKLGKH